MSTTILAYELLLTAILASKVSQLNVFGAKRFRRPLPFTNCW